MLKDKKNKKRYTSRKDKFFNKHYGKDLRGLMSRIDIFELLERLGLPVTGQSGDVIRSYCPDHHLFMKKRPSDPHWVLNIKTGETFCHTEGRGSNIVYTLSRLWNISPRETVAKILGNDDDITLFQLQVAVGKFGKMFEEETEDRTVRNLHEFEEAVQNRIVYESGYEYFMKPPGKKPTLINKKTVDYFKVFQRTWGYYKDRVIIPVFMNDDMTGFVAVDILGKKRWLKKHPEAKERDYKKTLYPKGFKSGQNLFGFDEVKKNAERVILVEGPRDQMKLWQQGYTDCLSIFGTNVTNGHILLLSQLNPRNIIIALDGDEAGQNASIKAAKKLRKMFSVYIAKTPDGNDPKTLDKRTLRSVIRKSVNVEE